MKFGLYSYVLPFILVYFPEILLQGSVVDNITLIAKAIFSIFCFESAAEGFMLNKVNLFERLFLFLACLLIYSSNYVVMFVAILFLGCIITYQVYKRKVLLNNTN